MSDSVVKAIALFFFFSMLDERRAVVASSEATEFYLRRAQKNPDLNPQIILVSATNKVWEKHKKKLQRGRPQYGSDSGWILPENIDMGAWKEFQKKATDEELLAVIWSKILLISDEEISLGIGVTQGTLRFRVGRALRKLGIFKQQSSALLTVLR